MNEYSARNYASFAAMDVHARSITVATLDTTTGETATKRLGGRLRREGLPWCWVPSAEAFRALRWAFMHH